MQKANYFVLTGDHMQVVYSATSLNGQPLVHYQDAHLVRNFTGDDIRRVDTDLGELVSVTLHLTPDAGSTNAGQTR